MPRNSSAWVDIRVHLLIVAVLLAILFLYNPYIAGIGLILLVTLFVYGRERCRERQRALEEYYEQVIKNVNAFSNYAIEHLPLAILVAGQDGRVRWCNDELAGWLGGKPAVGTSISDFWGNLNVDPLWGKEGELVFAGGERFYKARYRPIFIPEDEAGLMVFYVTDVTDYERMKREKIMTTPVLSYIQIDNYDEVLQGLSESQRTAIVAEVNRLLDAWVGDIGAFLRRTAEDTYVAVLDRRALNKALEEKFDILDKVRAVQKSNAFPITLSLGVAVGGSMSLTELGKRAQAGLDLALGRGGDQVAVQIEGKTQFYGGKAKAVEKHTRVKARVVAHALKEIIEGADLVLIMGHHNEDFDSLGAAMGVAKMARYLGKEAHIILSSMNEGIDKFADLIQDDGTYENLFISAELAGQLMALKPLLFVVDTHIPHLTAAPVLLEKIEHVIVIDHHRRSEKFIVSPLLIYIEPGSSSTSELVTELLMYFSDDLKLDRLEATALYAGMVVDTKNFAVQTGVRTFDAAGYLRRSGADPVVVRHLFRSDYETSRAKAQAMSNSQLLPGGLIVAVCPKQMPNAQVTAAQIADSMLRIEDVRMSLVLFHLGDGVGISARSTGEINVQMILEKFGGGGHQNVAGAQIVHADIEEIKRRAVALSVKYIEESDKSESDSAARS